MNIEQCINKIKSYDGPPLKFMEVCGTHTHFIFKYGIHSILPEKIKLISGPGCPVCVTPPQFIDKAVSCAEQEGAAVYTFGDMMRVPGTKSSLAAAKESGFDVRVMYSPMQVLDDALQNPDKQFFVAAVGFETTIPAFAMLLEGITEKGIKNVKFITAFKALMPALEMLARSGAAINGFIGPGHVSAIIGSGAYEAFCQSCRVPLTVAGFSFEQIIAAIYDLVLQNEKSTFEARNLYKNAVTKEGNTAARNLIDKYFERRDAAWRGIGEIPLSGYYLKPEFAHLDAGSTFEYSDDSAAACRCGEVITGKCSPADCPLFGSVCDPQHPVGPCMVSAEGTCGIWHRNKA